jgi:glycerate dehydrogenase
MENIVFLDRDSLKANLRRPSFGHEWVDYPETRPEEVIERLHKATMVITNKVPLREENLSKLDNIKYIGVAATGVDIIDVPYCRKRNIPVSNIRNYAYRTVPEHTLMLILALKRNLLRYREDIFQGKWQNSKTFCLLDHDSHDLYGSTIGIIGHGSLGNSVAKLAEALGMKVLISEHKGAKDVREGRTSFERVLSESDIISLHCPLNDKTRNMIGTEELRKMKPTAVLVNTARGGLVDEMALVEALKTGVIAGAGFDVLTSEPPRNGNPLLDLQLPNLIVTPHNAWASIEAMQILADQLIDNIEAFYKGSPKNLVT